MRDRERVGQMEYVNIWREGVLARWSLLFADRLGGEQTNLKKKVRREKEMSNGTKETNLKIHKHR